MLRRNFFGVAGLAPFASAQLRSQPPRLTPGAPVFLLGEEFLEDYWGLARTCVAPKKTSAGAVIRKDRPWEGMGPYIYGSVLRDPADQLWKCWYTVHDRVAYRERKPFPYRIGYATSKDGQAWHKPSLGLVEHGGNRDNNLVAIGVRDAEAIDVCLAPPDSGAPSRYLGLTLARGVRLYKSDDGVRWSPHGENAIDARHSDCHNSLCWDARSRRWLVYLRPPVFAGPGHSKRRISVMASQDLKVWSRPQTVVIPDEQDPPEFYSMPVFQRGNVFFGFLQIYDRRRESLEIELTYSADGYHWHRLPGRPVYLPTGASGSFDGGMVTTADDVVIDGDRMLVYYGAWDGDHKSNTRTATIACAEAPRDRFVGWRTAGSDDGYLLSRPCIVEAGQLLVNASVTKSLAVAVCDDEGVPLPGFTFDECTPVRGDSVRHALRWKKDLGELGGRTVRLRVRIGDGTVYAFEPAPASQTFRR